MILCLQAFVVSLQGRASHRCELRICLWRWRSVREAIVDEASIVRCTDGRRSRLLLLYLFARHIHYLFPTNSKTSKHHPLFVDHCGGGSIPTQLPTGRRRDGCVSSIVDLSQGSHQGPLKIYCLQMGIIIQEYCSRFRGEGVVWWCFIQGSWGFHFCLGGV